MLLSVWLDDDFVVVADYQDLPLKLANLTSRACELASNYQLLDFKFDAEGLWFPPFANRVVLK